METESSCINETASEIAVVDQEDSKREITSAKDINDILNVRVQMIKELETPLNLQQSIPIDSGSAEFIFQTRNEIREIMEGKSQKFLVIVGPCSIHDIDAGIEYATRLSTLCRQYHQNLLIVMRVYFEKPRTTVGWKGLIYDPDLDNSCQIGKGLRMARQLMHDITLKRVPIACEFLDTITPQYFSEYVSWAAIGARTTESQVHRQLASGLSMPVGFKNGTTGSVKVAMEAILAAAGEHTFCGTNEHGRCSVVHTLGNKHCHVVLRGSTSSPNYDKNSVEVTYAACVANGIAAPILIDCSHDNSGKNYRTQKHVLLDVLETYKNPCMTRKIFGVMLESNLVEGKQAIGPKMVFGQSITDGCIGWIETVELLKKINATVQTVREKTIGCPKA